MTTAPPAAQESLELGAGWTIAGKLHGGYLLAVAVESAMRSLDATIHPHPIAVTAQYVAAPEPGPATVRTSVIRAGRTLANLRVELVQGTKVCLAIGLTAGRLPDTDVTADWSAGDVSAPTLPEVESCVGGRQHAEVADRTPRVRIGSLLVRLDPASAPPPYGPGGNGDFRAWLSHGESWSPQIGALALADALPPVVFDLGIRGWVPTLQLQVLVRRVPAPGWLIGRQRAITLAGGLIDEECTLWNPDGTLVVQARQLAMVLTG